MGKSCRSVYVEQHELSIKSPSFCEIQQCLKILLECWFQTAICYHNKLFYFGFLRKGEYAKLIHEVPQRNQIQIGDVQWKARSMYQTKDYPFTAARSSSDTSTDSSYTLFPSFWLLIISSYIKAFYASSQPQTSQKTLKKLTDRDEKELERFMATGTFRDKLNADSATHPGGGPDKSSLRPQVDVRQRTVLLRLPPHSKLPPGKAILYVFGYDRNLAGLIITFRFQHTTTCL